MSEIPLDRALNIAAAAAQIGVSRASVYVLINTGKLKPFHVGTRTLFLASEVARFLAAAQSEPA
jgi:excisionase family DNA binding protein